MLGIPFYNETIKQAVAVFGSLFNNIVVRRRDGKVIPVPIAYGPRSKWLEAQKGLQREEELFEKLLPRLSYELVAMSYDPTRKLTNAQRFSGIHTTGKSIRQSIPTPVPYDLDFSLYLQTKNLNDGWQVVEQILPFFTPSYTVKVRHFPNDHDSETPLMTNTYDMPFTLQGITWADDWTGEIEERRDVEWTLEFNTKVWLSGPAAATSVIYDSRALITTPPAGETIDSMTRLSAQEGTEVGYVALDSEVVVYENDIKLSPNIINTIDSDGNIVKVIRAIDELEI